MRAEARCGTPFGSRRRHGFSLLELLTLIWALAIVVLIGTALLLGSVKMEWAAAASYRRLTLRSELADQFRADVAQAVALPDRLDQVGASPTCVILRSADGGHVIYRWDHGTLERSVLGASDTSRRHVPLGFDPESVEFLRTGRDRRMVALRLTELRGPTKVKREIEIAAALGDDVP